MIQMQSQPSSNTVGLLEVSSPNEVKAKQSGLSISNHSCKLPSFRRFFLPPLTALGYKAPSGWEWARAPRALSAVEKKRLITQQIMGGDRRAAHSSILRDEFSLLFSAGVSEMFQEGLRYELQATFRPARIVTQLWPVRIYESRGPLSKTLQKRPPQQLAKAQQFWRVRKYSKAAVSRQSRACDLYLIARLRL